jgi:hypothetical protein
MRRLFACCLLLGVALPGWGADFARTIRTTELKAQPYSDARTLENLPARSRVEVLKRQSGWTRVKTATASGWVKMLSLRVEAGTGTKRGDSGLGALFNVASTGKSGSTVTTGVRGLSEEQLTNAQPDAKALQAAKRYAVSKQEAQRYAAEGKLQAQSVDYLSGGR